MPSETFHIAIGSTRPGRNYPFREVVAVLSGFEMMLESSFETLSDELEIPRSRRPTLDVIAEPPVVGSYLQDLKVVVDEALPATAVVVSQLTPWQILEYARKAIDAVKWVLDHFHRERTLPNLVIKNTNGDVILASEGSHIEVNNFQFQLAAGLESSVLKIAEALASGKIGSASLASDKETVAFTSDDMRLAEAASPDGGTPMKRLLRKYERKRKLKRPGTAPLLDGDSEQLVELMGEITSLNKKRKSGKLRIAGGQNLPPGEYKFKAVGADPIDEYIEAMRQSKTQFRCIAVARARGIVLRVLSIKPV